MDLLSIGGPPVKESVSTDEVRLPLEGQTALRLDFLQGGKVREADIGQGLVGERPEVFGGLQLRGVGRQREKMDAVGHLDLLAGVPSGAIQHQRDSFGGPCSHLPGEGSQHLGVNSRLKVHSPFSAKVHRLVTAKGHSG